MSALKTPEKTSKRQELRQDSIVTLYAKALMYFEENRNVVYGALAGVVVVALGIAGYAYYQTQQQEQAQQLLAQIVTTYEQGNYQQALDGTAETLGLLEIADQYGGTQAGNLATFYAADALYRMGEFDRALTYFQRFDKTNDLIGASALAAEAAIYESRDAFATAAKRYQEAAHQFESDLTTPRYLMDAGEAYVEAGEYEQALSVYQTIKDEYPESEQAQNIDRYIAQVRARQQ